MTQIESKTRRSIRTLDDFDDKPRWVAWREEERKDKNGEIKKTKVPYNPRNDRQAASNDPTTWGTRDEAQKRWDRMRVDDPNALGGIGIVLGDLGDGLHLMGGDLDGCLAGDELIAWADEIVERFDTYTEVSPSDKGVKLYFLTSADDAATIAELMGKTRKAFVAGPHHEVALDCARYYAVTDVCLGDCRNLRQVTVDDVRWLLEDAGPRFKQQFGKAVSDKPQSSGRDESGSGYGFRFLADCKRRGESYEAAKVAILADSTEAGEWARRKDDRDIKLAYDNATGVQSNHSWDDPDISMRDERRGDLPEFPLDALRPPWLQEYIRRNAHGAGVAVDGVVVTFMGIASGLIGQSPLVKAAGWPVPCTVWAATVAPPGWGKTPSTDVANRALVASNEELQTLNEARRRRHEMLAVVTKAKTDKWKDDVQKAVKAGHPTPEQPDLPKVEKFIAPHLYINDVSIEKMAVLLQARPQGMILFMDELAGWFANMGRYSAGDDRAFWLRAWDGKDFNQGRMEREVRVKNLLVGVVGGLQPDKVREVFKGAHDGAYARFLFCWPQLAPYQSLREGVQQVEPEILAVFNRLANLPAAKNIHMPLDRKALAAFEEFRQYHKAEMKALDGHELEWWAKADAQVLRLTGTLFLLHWAVDEVERQEELDLPPRIHRAYVKAAIGLVRDYFWPHARACLRQIELEQSATYERIILRWLKAKDCHQFTSEDIRRSALSMRRNADQTETLLNNLARAGWVRRIAPESGKVGRPKDAWEVNAKLFTEARV